MGRIENVAIFEDTKRLYYINDRLRSAVEQSLSSQVLVRERDPLPSHSGEKRRDQIAKVTVSRKRSYEAASAYAGKGLKVCVHNFASAANPGGGVTRGAGAQEECLCRTSTLYPCLNSEPMWDGFYKPHRAAHDPLHNDDCIYTPGVVVFKSDTYLPEPLSEEKWYTVDVLTCAAPNLRETPSNAFNPSDGAESVFISDTELQKLHEKRLRRMFDLACEKQADVLILGAFGCGAFRNPPAVVASAARTVVKDYLYCLDAIEFAIYCRPEHEENYTEFARKLNNIR